MAGLNYIYLNNRAKLLREETVEDVNNIRGPLALSKSNDLGGPLALSKSNDLGGPLALSKSNDLGGPNYFSEEAINRLDIECNTSSSCENVLKYNLDYARRRLGLCHMTIHASCKVDKKLF